MNRAIVWLVAAALLAGCAAKPSVADFGSAAPESDAPRLPSDTGLDLADVDASSVLPPSDPELAEVTWEQAASWIRRETQAGDPVLVSFFASWCENCKRELPLLQETATRDDVAVLGISHLDNLESSRAMLEDHGVTFPTLFDPAGEIAPQVGARGLPHTVLFDRHGRLAGRVFGELNEARLEQLLAQTESAPEPSGG